MPDKKEEKQMLVLQVMFCVFLYIIFQNFILTNLKHNVELKGKEIKKLQQQSVQNMRNINTMEKKYKLYYKSFYEKEYLNSKLLRSEEKQFLANSITELSTKNNILLSRVKLKQEEQKKTIKYILSADFETDFFTLKNFLNDIDELEKDINLEEINISKMGDRLRISTIFSIYLYD